MGVRYLLDTHAVIWLHNEPHRLPTPLLSILEDPANDVMVSSASAWEIATKHRIGRLPGIDGLVSGWGDALSAMGLRDLVSTSRHMLLAGSMTWDHRDPFDRLLVAQAMLEDATLVTNDRAVTAGSTVRTRW